MSRFVTRRHALSALGGGVLLSLTGCGGSIHNPFKPKRILSVGDALSDVGQSGQSWTVHDGSSHRTFIEQFASLYGLTLTASSAGGTAHGWGGATVSGGNHSLSEQVDAVIQNGIQSTDLVVIQGGTQDIVNAFTATGVSDQTRNSVKTSAMALAALVQKLVASGAQSMLVMGIYNLKLTPWGLSKTAAEQSFLQEICIASTSTTTSFNATLSVHLMGLPRNVVVFDIGNIFSGLSRSNITQGVCTTADASTCTSSQLVSGVTDPNTYLFADNLYLTPEANRHIGTSAHTFTTALF